MRAPFFMSSRASPSCHVERPPSPPVMSSVPFPLSSRAQSRDLCGLPLASKGAFMRSLHALRLVEMTKGLRHIEDSVKLTLLRVKWEFTRSKVPLYDG